jgi:hypothetical protein
MVSSSCYNEDALSTPAGRLFLVIVLSLVVSITLFFVGTGHQSDPLSVDHATNEADGPTEVSSSRTPSRSWLSQNPRRPDLATTTSTTHTSDTVDDTGQHHRPRTTNDRSGPLSDDTPGTWRCACQGTFLPPGLLRTLGGAEAVLRMGGGQCYHQRT